jgi:hypothetical protein
MLVLMGISAIAFLRRFSSDLASVVVLYFCSLTVMLFTPLVTHPGILGGTAPGGIRYFSLVAILPTFYIIFDMMKISSFNISVRNYVLLPVQVAIFAFAVLIRGSAASLIGAIMLVWLVLVWLVLAWQNRRNPRRFRLQVHKLAILVLVPVVLVGTIALLVPRDYLTEGRFGTVVWHRVFTSLGWNPAYPFPGVNEMFAHATRAEAFALLAGLSNERPTIVLAHDPVWFAHLPEGPHFMLAVEERGQWLYVTSGIGTSGLPLRWGVPPEIVVPDMTGK